MKLSVIPLANMAIMYFHSMYLSKMLQIVQWHVKPVTKLYDVTFH
jgi:hypothetical protein